MKIASFLPSLYSKAIAICAYPTCIVKRSPFGALRQNWKLTIQINEIFDGVEKKNPGKNFVKHYDQMPHGWLAARGDVSCFSSRFRFHLVHVDVDL